MPFKTDWQGSVSGQDLLKTLSMFDTSNIKLELTKDKTQLIVQTISSKVKLPIRNAKLQELVQENFLITQKDYKPLHADVLSGLRLCAFSVASMNEGQPCFTGVHLSDENVASSDNFRLSHYTLQDGVGPKASTLLHGESCQLLMADEFTKVFPQDKWWHFRTNNGSTLAVPVVDTTFPIEQFTTLLPSVKQLDKAQLVELPEQLKVVVKRASYFVSSQELFQRKIGVSSHNNKLIIQASSPEHGDFQEILPFPGANKFTFEVNPAFLTEALKYVNTIHMLDERKLVMHSDSFTHIIALYDQNA